jgi:xanthine/uracil permease
MNAIYLVLVAIIIRSTRLTAGESVNLMGVACVAMAIGTTLQALPRGPVGSGFLAPPVYSATYLAPSVLAAQIGGMPLVFGMTITAGIMELAIALLITRLRMVITPVLSGLTVFVVGLQLGVVVIGQMLDVHHEALPSFHRHLVVTLLTLATCVGLSIWGKGALKLLCSMLALIIGMVAAVVLKLISFDDVVGSGAWLALPRPVLLQYGFSSELLPAFLAAGVAAALRAVGVVTTCQRINDAAWQQPDMTNVRKGVLADGAANLIGGIIGAPGMCICAESGWDLQRYRRDQPRHCIRRRGSAGDDRALAEIQWVTQTFVPACRYQEIFAMHRDLVELPDRASRGKFLPRPQARTTKISFHLYLFLSSSGKRCRVPPFSIATVRAQRFCSYLFHEK